MVEIIAVVRPNKAEATKQALIESGHPAFTCMKVQGRGKRPIVLSVGKNKTVTTNLLTKEYFMIEVEDDEEETVVKRIMDVNWTGKPGDGRIFVSAAGNTYSVRGNIDPDVMPDHFLPEELI